MNQLLEKLRFDNVHLSTGVRLHYAEQGDRTGEPIIFLHGYTDSWFSFSSLLFSLSSTYHAFALDQRGHGDSDRPDRGYRLQDLAADVIAFMDAMNLQAATIVGHCMGSFVGQQVALVAPHRVRKLVLIGSGTTLRQEAIVELLDVVARLNDPVPEEFVRAFQAGTVYKMPPDEFMDRIVKESLKLPARIWSAALTGLLEADPSLPLSQLGVPALILWGDKDPIFSRAEQYALATHIRDAALKVCSLIGHSPHWERPHQVAYYLEDFISWSPTGKLFHAVPAGT